MLSPPPPPPTEIEINSINKYLNVTHTLQSMLDHQAWKDVDPSREVIADVAVFLLGTLSGAVQLGETKLSSRPTASITSSSGWWLRG